MKVILAFKAVLLTEIVIFVSNAGFASNICISSRGNRQKLQIFHMNLKLKYKRRQSKLKFHLLKCAVNHSQHFTNEVNMLFFFEQTS